MNSAAFGAGKMPRSSRKPLGRYLSKG
jgi:hypothetical protein